MNMIEDDRLKIIIGEFAEKHGILQMDYVNERFYNNDYKAIDRKFFVSIDIYSQKTTEIGFGIIRILYEDIEEEEWFSFDHDCCLFYIDICNFPTEESLMEEIVKMCKKYGLINMENELSDSDSD